MGRREENKARKRAQLLAAAQRAFTEHGFEATTIEQIAADAGVARGTFYLYFETKEAVFRAVVAVALEPIGALLATAREQIRGVDDVAVVLDAFDALRTGIADVLRAHRDALALYYVELRQPGEVGDWLRGQARFLEDFVAEACGELIGHGVMREAPPRLVALVVIGAIDRLVYGWVNGSLTLDPADIGAMAIPLLIEGLIAAPPTG